MKILHCCLAAFYIDNYSYQENILPKMHKKMGYEVEILASTETYIDNIKLGYISDGIYTTEQGISITRIPYCKWLPDFLVRKLRIYKGIKEYLNISKPDMIFLHDCQFLSIHEFVKYAKNNKVEIFIDCHTDFINSGKNIFSKFLLHKIIYKQCAKKIEKYASMFYGTLPLRVDFLNQVYGINKNKIKLLPFGADDSLFEWCDRERIGFEMRKKLNLNNDDVVFISGGKIDIRKNIHVLGKAFIELVEEKKIINSKLIIFGKCVDELKIEIEKISAHPYVRYVEWISSEEIYAYFLASDLAFFPGTHSVLWEEAIGLGLPCIFLKWTGIEHVDLGGNSLFIESSDIQTIKKVLLDIIKNKSMLAKMKEVSLNKGPEIFSYSKIAARSIMN